MKQLFIAILIGSLSIIGVSGCASTQATDGATVAQTEKKVFCPPGQTGKGRCGTSR